MKFSLFFIWSALVCLGKWCNISSFWRLINDWSKLTSLQYLALMQVSVEANDWWFGLMRMKRDIGHGVDQPKAAQRKMPSKSEVLDMLAKDSGVIHSTSPTGEKMEIRNRNWICMWNNKRIILLDANSAWRNYWICNQTLVWWDKRLRSFLNQECSSLELHGATIGIINLTIKLSRVLSCHWTKLSIDGY